MNPKIITWANAIAKWEGANPLSNNPGNMKFTSLTASWGATKGRKALDGGYFCKFATPQAGFNALCNFLILGCENQLIAFHKARDFQSFTKIFAGNPPQGYIQGIATELGIPLSTPVSQLLT